MEFQEVLQKRHSVRRFVPSQISDEALLRIVEAGRIAPSGGNKQNREFIVIRDRGILGQIHERLQKCFAEAAAAIAVVVDPTPTQFGPFWVQDVSAAVENMLLTVVNEGYDSVWIEGLIILHEDWLKDLLGVPADRRVTVLLPIGKAAEPGKSPAKAKLSDILYLDRYGQKMIQANV